MERQVSHKPVLTKSMSRRSCGFYSSERLYMQALYYCFCCMLSTIIRKAQVKQMPVFSIHEWEGKRTGAERIKTRPPTQSSFKSTFHMHDHNFSTTQEKPQIPYCKLSSDTTTHTNLFPKPKLRKVNCQTLVCLERE